MATSLKYSVLAVFDSPVEGVECAAEIQRELARRNRQLAPLPSPAYTAPLPLVVAPNVLFIAGSFFSHGDQAT